VKHFLADAGGGYTSKNFAEYLQSDGILNGMTMPYIPQSTTVIEPATSTIIECIRYMLDHAELSNKYLAFAVTVFGYHKSCIPVRSVVGKTPYKAWHGRKLFLKLLSVSGCLEFEHVP
jgi:hypothetical protein